MQQGTAILSHQGPARSSTVHHHLPSAWQPNQGTTQRRRTDRFQAHRPGTIPGLCGSSSTIYRTMRKSSRANPVTGTAMGRYPEAWELGTCTLRIRFVTFEIYHLYTTHNVASRTNVRHLCGLCYTWDTYTMATSPIHLHVQSVHYVPFGRSSAPYVVVVVHIYRSYHAPFSATVLHQESTRPSVPIPPVESHHLQCLWGWQLCCSGLVCTYATTRLH